MVDRLETLINTSKVVPVSGSLLVDKKKVLELVDQLRLAIPQEVKQAEEVLTQKDQIMNNAMVEARRAKSQAEDEFMEKLNQNELLKRAEEMLADAEHKANRITDQAEAEAHAKRTEADAYALETTNKEEPLISMLKGLAASNLSHLTPHPLMVFLSYSHPPVLERISAVRSS